MQEFSDSVIREQLATIGVVDDITIRYLDRMRDDINRFGQPFTARQRMLQTWEARLRGARRFAPDDRAGQDRCESWVSALRAVGPDEPLYSWSAKTSAGHYYSGVSTPLRIISIDCTDDLHDPIT